jgi:hypothetical protein
VGLAAPRGPQDDQTHGSLVPQRCQTHQTHPLLIIKDNKYMQENREIAVQSIREQTRLESNKDEHN